MLLDSMEEGNQDGEAEQEEDYGPFRGLSGTNLPLHLASLCVTFLLLFATTYDALVDWHLFQSCLSG